MTTGTIKPIPECVFCRVRPERRTAQFENHPKCAACQVLMGPGHAEQNVADYCSTCTRTRERVA